MVLGSYGLYLGTWTLRVSVFGVRFRLRSPSQNNAAHIAEARYVVELCGRSLAPPQTLSNHLLHPAEVTAVLAPLK